MQIYLGAAWNHTESLAVEEHFCILFAMVVVVLARTKDSSINPFGFLVSTILSTMILVLVLRCMVERMYPAGDLIPLLLRTIFRWTRSFWGFFLHILFCY